MYEKIKVLIAGDNLKWSVYMAKYLRTRYYEVKCINYFKNVTDFISETMQYKPHIIVLNVHTIQCDIFWFIKKLRELLSKSHIILLISKPNKKAETILEQDNPISFVRMPYEPHMINEKILSKFIFPKEFSILDKILFFSKRLGIKVKFNGFNYLNCAIFIKLTESDKFSLVTRDVYPEIALRYGTNTCNVERCIRTCICDFMKREENKKYIFELSIRYGFIPANFKLESFKISNVKFINLLSNLFRDFYM